MAVRPCRMIHDCSRWGQSCIEGVCAVPGYHQRCLPGVVECQVGYTCHSHSRRCVTLTENHKGYHGSIIDCTQDQFFDENLGKCRQTRKLGEMCDVNQCEMGTMCSNVEKVCRPTCVLGSVTFGCSTGQECRKLEEHNLKYSASPLGYCMKSVSIRSIPENTKTATREGNNPMVVFGLLGFMAFACIGLLLFRMSARKRTVVYTNATPVGSSYVAGPNGNTVYYTNNAIPSSQQPQQQSSAPSQHSPPPYTPPQ